MSPHTLRYRDRKMIWVFGVEIGREGFSGSTVGEEVLGGLAQMKSR